MCLVQISRRARLMGDVNNYLWRVDSLYREWAANYSVFMTVAVYYSHEFCRISLLTTFPCILPGTQKGHHLLTNGAPGPLKLHKREIFAKMGCAFLVASKAYQIDDFPSSSTDRRTCAFASPFLSSMNLIICHPLPKKRTTAGSDGDD